MKLASLLAFLLVVVIDSLAVGLASRLDFETTEALLNANMERALRAPFPFERTEN